jgi:hypothetical protein
VSKWEDFMKIDETHKNIYNVEESTVKGALEALEVLLEDFPVLDMITANNNNDTVTTRFLCR